MQKDPKTGKYGRLACITEVLGPIAATEFKALSDEERTQLASSAAAQLGVPVEELGFVPCEY